MSLPLSLARIARARMFLCGHLKKTASWYKRCWSIEIHSPRVHRRFRILSDTIGSKHESPDITQTFFGCQMSHRASPRCNCNAVYSVSPLSSHVGNRFVVHYTHIDRRRSFVPVSSQLVQFVACVRLPICRGFPRQGIITLANS